MSDSLRPHELQHARPPCPSPTPYATCIHILFPVCLSGCVNAVSLFQEVILQTRSEELGAENEEEEKPNLGVHNQSGHHDRHLSLSISANI